MRFTPPERRTFWACFLGWMLDGMDFMVYPLVIGTVIGLWQVERGAAGLAVTLTLLFSAVGGWAAGYLSDRIGRKRIMLGGCVLAALTYLPIYHGMKALANPTMAPSVTTLSLASAAGLVALLFIQMTYVAMVYGPIAAYLVELFPTSIRYTSMSLPYHLGNGWFGGFLPLIATAVTTSAWARATFGESAIYAGLIYPIVVCVMTAVIGGLFIHETKDHRIDTPIRT